MYSLPLIGRRTSSSLWRLSSRKDSLKTSLKLSEMRSKWAKYPIIQVCSNSLMCSKMNRTCTLFSSTCQAAISTPTSLSWATWMPVLSKEFWSNWLRHCTTFIISTLSIETWNLTTSFWPGRQSRWKVWMERMTSKSLRSSWLISVCLYLCWEMRSWVNRTALWCTRHLKSSKTTLMTRRSICTVLGLPCICYCAEECPSRTQK